MKSILTTAILFFAILNGVQSQTMEKSYWNYLQVNNPKTIQPFEWRMKPKSVHYKRNRVVVVFDRKEWERAQEMRKEMVHRRGMMLRRNPQSFYRKPELNLPKENK